MYFNSIKVQLKRMEYIERYRSHALFQFHKGTIKAHTAEELAAMIPVFQFHKGTIKARAERGGGGGRAAISIP